MKKRFHRIIVLFPFLTLFRSRVDELKGFLSSLEEVIDLLFDCISSSDLREHEDWLEEVEECMPARLSSFKHLRLLLNELYKRLTSSESTPYAVLKECFPMKRISNATDLSSDGGLVKHYLSSATLIA